MRVLLLLLLLAGCKDIPTTHSETRIREIAREEQAGLASTIDHNAVIANQRSDDLAELERRVGNLERENRELRLELSLRD